MEIPDKAWVVVGAIAAAVIAGVVSFVNMLIAKDQKITEFRQAWINSLRDEVAGLLAHAAAIPAAGRVVDFMQSLAVVPKDTDQNIAEKKMDTAKEMLGLLRVDVKEMKGRYNKILLLLNPDENKVLFEQLEALVSTATLSSGSEQSNINEQCFAIVKETQRTLKKEWKRVKRGELTYVITKGIIVVFISLLVIMPFVAWDEFKKVSMVKSIGQQSLTIHSTGTAQKPTPPVNSPR